MWLSNLRHSRAKSFIIVISAYLIAFIFARYSLQLLTGFPLLWQIFVADVGATVIIFLFSFTFSNSSIYDPYWSVAPPFIVWFWIYHAPGSANALRQIVILVLISIWAIRLTLNWARGWKGLNHEDWRYRDLANKTGKIYWLVSFLGIHLFPTIIVFLGCLPLIYSLNNSKPLGIIDAVAFLITIGAISIETIADEQLRLFKKKDGKGLMKNGIWSYSRHPNYLGEISFWLGIFVFSITSENPGFWWTSIGFLTMVALFTFISIPMMEKRMIEKRPEFLWYRKRVPMLLPLPGKLIRSRRKTTKF